MNGATESRRSRSPKIDTAHLARAVGSALAGGVATVERLEPAASSARTFAVRLVGGQTVVAKVLQRDQPAFAARHTIDVLRGLDVPTPQVLATTALDGAGPHNVLIMTRLPGRDLHHELSSMSAQQLTVLAGRVVDIETRVGSLPVVGSCGYLPIGWAGERTWLDIVRHPNGYRYADPLPADTAPLLARLCGVIDAAGGALSDVEPRCFLDDLTTKNVLIEHGRLSGVVDVEVVCQGDRRFHQGLTAAAVTVDGAPLGNHYLAELARFARFGTEDQRFVDLYTAVFLVNFLGAEHPYRPGEWRRRAADGADAALTRAARFFGA